MATENVFTNVFQTFVLTSCFPRQAFQIPRKLDHKIPRQESVCNGLANHVCVTTCEPMPTCCQCFLDTCQPPTHNEPMRQAPATCRTVLTQPEATRACARAIRHSLGQKTDATVSPIRAAVMPTNIPSPRTVNGGSDGPRSTATTRYIDRSSECRIRKEKS